jgi:hypothetical protein
VQVGTDRGQRDVEDEEREHRQEAAGDQGEEGDAAETLRPGGRDDSWCGGGHFGHGVQTAADGIRVVRACLSWYQHHLVPLFYGRARAARMKI